MKKYIVGIIVIALLTIAGYVGWQFYVHSQGETFEQTMSDEELEKLFEQNVEGKEGEAGAEVTNEFEPSDDAQSQDQQQEKQATDETASEEGPVAQEEEVQGPVLVSQGDFIRVDAAHYAEGQASIYTTASGPVLRFENFQTPDGPDLFVYLSKNSPKTQSDPLGEFVNLGSLKSISGTQAYALPENYAEYESVIIWCRAFGVLFSSAELQ